ncbi:MAG: SMP-30/gluconolactonase/LRE family protein [Pseudomonadota bacterium]
MKPIAPIELAALNKIGRDLNRPECVLCTSDGVVYVSDWAGGVCRIPPRGRQTRILARKPPVDLKPNGIALLEDGSFLLANLGDDGGVWQLASDGSVRPFLTQLDSVPLPPTNYVLADSSGRIWITVSTRAEPRANAYRSDVGDGFIALVDAKGARIVADGLGYTNEVQLHPSGDWLYVNETFARRTSRMRLGSDGGLGPRETVTEYGPGTFPDGLCFDEAGGFWIVSLVSNRVVRVTPDGRQTVLLEDVETEFLETVEAAFQSGRMGRSHLDSIRSERLGSTSSIAFGGPERRLSYLGCLLGRHIMSFEAPVAGIAPVHWHWRMR